jgi:hypothetical protein
MKAVLIIVLAVVVLFVFSIIAHLESPEAGDSGFLSEAKAAMTASLKDPESARFDSMHVVRLGEKRIACGLFNAKNSLGGYVGWQPFFYDGYFAQPYPAIKTSSRPEMYREKILACDPGREQTPLAAALREIEEKEKKRQEEARSAPNSFGENTAASPPNTFGGRVLINPYAGR